MSQDENKLKLSSESTNIIVDDQKVKEETTNVVEKEDHKPQLSSEINNVALEVSEVENGQKPELNITKTQLFLVFIGLALAIFLAALDQTIVATALPAIAIDFNAFDQISWVGTAYLLTATAFQPTYGKLSDIFGRKPVFLSAIFLFEIGSLLCGLSINMTMLIISRAVAGLGGGGILGLVLIIISEIVPIHERGKYQGIIGGVFGIASVVGPLLGVITFITVILFLHLPNPTGSLWLKLTRIDWFGTFTLVTATILLLLPLNWAGSTYPWSSPIIIVLLCVGGVGYIVFAYIEWKVAKAPIAPIVACFCVNIFHGMTFFALVFFIPLYFQVVRSESATTSGLELLPLILGVAIMAIVTGQLVSRTVFFSYGIICAFGGILMAVGSGLISTFSESTTRGEIIGYSIIAGVGAGSIMQITILAGQGIVERKDIAVVTSLLAFFRIMGAVFGVAITGTVFNNVLNENLPPQFQNQKFTSSTGPGGPIPEFVIKAFLLALDSGFRIVVVFAGLSFVSSLPLLRVKPHRNYNETEIKFSLE
ncbi:289_t:CDS:10 [Scutellospora calospora]|uniref:289_t:CDS:1 n=1 Tax=Scutellospora calospora TaxID=85575 RepID=A0ACA9LXM8_9GLOM|nr:289_t:CDS:10 [Scutellospora calospora]